MFPAAVGPSGDFEETGTAGPVTLQGGGAGRLFLSYTLPATPQGDLGHSESAFYIVDLAAPFGRSDLEGGAFTLTIGSDDCVEARLLRGVRRRYRRTRGRAP